MAPCVVASSTIATFAEVLKADVTASKIFTALSLFRMLQDPLRSLPSSITQFYQAISSVERLQEYYAMDEKENLELDMTETDVPSPIYHLSLSALKSPSTLSPICDSQAIIVGSIYLESSELIWIDLFPNVTKKKEIVKRQCTELTYACVSCCCRSSSSYSCCCCCRSEMFDEEDIEYAARSRQKNVEHIELSINGSDSSAAMSSHAPSSKSSSSLSSLSYRSMMNVFNKRNKTYYNDSLNGFQGYEMLSQTQHSAHNKSGENIEYPSSNTEIDNHLYGRSLNYDPASTLEPYGG